MATAGTISVGLNLTQAQQQANTFFNKVRQFNVSVGGAQQISKLTADAKEFDRQLQFAYKRVLSFSSAGAAFFGVVNALKSLASTTVQVEKTMTDINAIFQSSTKELANFSREIFKIGNETGQTFFNAADAAKEFARQGLNLNETLKRTKDALLLTRLSGLSVQDSIDTITASVNSYSDSLLTSAQVVNKLIAVDNRFATSAASLGEAIQRSASAAQDAGLSFDQYLGLITAIQQRTARAGSVVGNSLKTIFARISDVDTVQRLKEFGIEIDKSTDAVTKLKGVAKAIELDPQFADEVRKIVGGVYQLNAVSAAFRDLASQNSAYAEATDVAANATDEAIARNKVYKETLVDLINVTKNNLTRAGANVGNLTFAPVAKDLLKTFNSGASGGLFPGLEGLNKNLEQDGFSLGRALLKGLGDFISGPGVLGISVALGRLFVEFIKKGGQALFSFINLQDALKKTDETMISMNRSSSRQVSLAGNLVSAAGRNLATQQQILGVIQQQNTALAQNAVLNNSFVNNFNSGNVPISVPSQSNLINNNLQNKISNPASIVKQQSFASSSTFKSIDNFGVQSSANFGAENINKINDILRQIASLSSLGTQNKKISDLISEGNKIIDSQSNAGPSSIRNREIFQNLIRDAVSSLKLGKLDLPRSTSTSFPTYQTGLPQIFSSPASYVTQIPQNIPPIQQSSTSFNSRSFSGSGSSLSNVSNTTSSYSYTQGGQVSSLLPLPPKTSFSFANSLPPTSSQALGFLPPGFAPKPTSSFRLQASGLTVLAPLVGGAISEGIGALAPRSQLNSPFVRGSQSLVDEAGQAIGQAGLGFAVGGVPGAVIGGAFGLARAVPKIIESFSSLMPKLNERFDQASTSLESLRTSLNDFVTISDKLADVYENRLKISGKEISDLEASRNAALIAAGISPEQKKSILEADTPEKRIGAIKDILDNAVRDRKDADTERSLRAAQESVPLFNKLNAFLNNSVGTGNLRGITELVGSLPLNVIRSLSQDNLNLLVNKTKNGLELNKEGVTAINPVFQDILTQRNQSGDRFIKLLENQETVTKILQKTEAGGSITQELRKLAESGGFTTAAERLGQLSSTEFGTSLPQAIEKYLASRIKDIPTNVTDLRKTDRGTAEENTRRQRAAELQDTSLLSLGGEFSARAQDFSIRRNLENNLLANAEALQQNKRENQLGVDKLFLSGPQIISTEGANAISSIQNEFTKRLRASVSDFSSGIDSALAEEINQFASKRFDSINKAKDITPEARGALISRSQTDISQVGNFIGQISSLQDLGDLTKTIVDKVSELDRLSAQGGLNDSQRDEFRDLKNFYFDILKKLLEISSRFEETTGTINQDKESSIKTSAGANNTNLLIAGFSKALERAGKENNIGAALFNAREALSIGRAIGDKSLQREGAAGLVSTYQSAGLDVPSDIRENLKSLLDVDEKIKEIPVVLESVRNNITNANQLFSSQAERVRVITELEQKRVDLQKLINERIVDSIQGQRQYALELNKILAAQSLTAFRRGDISGQEFRDQQQAFRDAEKNANGGRLSGQSIGEAFFDEFRYNTKDFYTDIENGAKTTAQTIKSSFKDAFNSFKDGSKDAGEAFQDFLLGIGNKIGDIALDIALNNIFGAAFGSLGNAFSTRRNSGGIINRYSTGGLVQGGSGVVDDIPATLTAGEYVLKKSAVQKYGPELLTKLNEGKAFFDGKNSIVTTDGNRGINAAFANTYLYDDPNKPTSGEFLTDPNLSSFALEDENNPQNQIKFGREGALGDYLRDRAAYDEQVASALRAYRKQRKQAATAALIQAGISLVGVGIGAYAQNKAASMAGQSLTSAYTGSTVVSQPITTSGMSYGAGATMGARGGFSSSNFGVSPTSNYYQGFQYNLPPPRIGRNMGGEIPYRRYASGGEVQALLTGGEFVATRRPVQAYGKQFFDRLNRGEIQVKKAEGGMIGDAPMSTPSSDDGIDRIIKALESRGQAGVTLNQEININISKNGSMDSKTSSNQSSQNQDDKEVNQSRQLAESINAAVMTIIQRELKPQGLIRSVISGS